MERITKTVMGCATVAAWMNERGHADSSAAVEGLGLQLSSTKKPCTWRKFTSKGGCRLPVAKTFPWYDDDTHKIVQYPHKWKVFLNYLGQTKYISGWQLRGTRRSSKTIRVRAHWKSDGWELRHVADKETGTMQQINWRSSLRFVSLCVSEGAAERIVLGIRSSCHQNFLPLTEGEEPEYVGGTRSVVRIGNERFGEFNGKAAAKAEAEAAKQKYKRRQLQQRRKEEEERRQEERKQLRQEEEEQRRQREAEERSLTRPLHAGDTVWAVEKMKWGENLEQTKKSRSEFDREEGQHGVVTYVSPDGQELMVKWWEVKSWGKGCGFTEDAYPVKRSQVRGEM